MTEDAALSAVAAAGIAHRVIRHAPVHSLAEAAEARGVAPEAVVKSLVVRRGERDYVFVLVPGDRTISWPKLRRILGERRLSLPPAGEAHEATGYERGTITPFGASHPWPVVADERIRGEITLGGGAHEVAVVVQADDVVRVLDATVADVTEPAP